MYLIFRLYRGIATTCAHPFYSFMRVRDKLEGELPTPFIRFPDIPNLVRRYLARAIPTRG